jgi:hypothetical protein
MARNVGINSTFEQQRLVINEIAVDVETLQNAAESDPLFSASPASGISSTSISNWNTAYGWGDHSVVGYTTITGVGTDGSINTVGVITASSFSGSASGLTNIPSGQLTGALPAIDGSALLNISGFGSGVQIQDSGTPVGTAGTINFGANLTVSPVSAGIVTVTASGGGGTSYWVETAAGIHTLSNVGVGTTNPISTFSVDGTVDVTGISTFHSDLRVSNADSNLRLGLKSNQFSNQLELRHSDGGGSSHIYHTGSGTFHLSMEQGIGDKIQFDTVSEVLCRMYRNGPVELYYDDSKKFETTSTGAVVTGILTATRFESTSAGTPTIDSPNNLNINAVTVAISTDLTVGGDVYVGVDTSSGLVLTSPNGTQYRLVVDNSGNLSTILVP